MALKNRNSLSSAAPEVFRPEKCSIKALERQALGEADEYFKKANRSKAGFIAVIKEDEKSFRSNRVISSKQRLDCLITFTIVVLEFFPRPSGFFLANDWYKRTTPILDFLEATYRLKHLEKDLKP